MSNKSFNRQNGSGELDVFEAAKYFSGYNNEASSYNCATLISQKTTRDERHDHHHQQSHTLFEKQVTKEKKHKQPSSPGGKLASFLNSLFNQTSSKKKKKKNSKPSTTQSMKDEEENSSGRRKRRMSISHFRSSNTVDTKSFYSSSSSGFRTPPPNYIADTPIKSYKVSDLLNEKRNEDPKFIDGFLEKYKNKNGRVDRCQSEDKDFRKFSEVDDGADSDSSSDLFELRSFDLGSYSSGLPVYETTNINSFKRGAPITNGVIRV